MSDLITVCMVGCTGKEHEYGHMQCGNQNCVTETIWLTTSNYKRLKEEREEHGTVTILLIVINCMHFQMHCVTSLFKYVDIG